MRFKSRVVSQGYRKLIEIPSDYREFFEIGEEVRVSSIQRKRK